MRCQSVRKSSRNAATRRGVTRNATCLWFRFRASGHVLRVVVLGIEASQSFRECLDRRVLLTKTFLSVTDKAEGSAWSIELRLVTVDALTVPGKLRLGGVVAALVTAVATVTTRQRCVLARSKVREFRVVLSGS